MREEYSLGPVPSDEECAQVGRDNYLTQAKSECRRYIDLLEKKFELLSGMRFKITRNLHDFGEYLDVVISFDDDNDEQRELACFIEDNLPYTWDDESPKKLSDEQ